MKLLLLLLALLIGEICLAEESTVPPKAKNGTGAGRYGGDRDRHDRHNNYDRHDRHDRRRDHDEDDYGKHRRYRTPIVDDYVCDLEATILVVSSKHHVKEEKKESYGQTPSYGNNSPGYGAPQQQYGGGSQYGGGEQSYGNNNSPGYGAPQQSYGGGESSYGGGSKGYEKPKRHEYATPDALRLKCSHIAVHSEHDCHTCCQLSARRYHSVSKHEIFGFIIDANEIKQDDKGYVRAKRDAEYGSQPANYQQPQGYQAPAQSYTPAYTAPEPTYPVPEYQEQPQAYSSDSTYAAETATSYAPKAYRSYGPPKNARCVCCAPKRHDHHDYHKRRDYDRHEDRDESREY